LTDSNENFTFILLYRKLLDSPVFHNEGLLKVWIWCLLRASFKERTVPVKTGRGITEVKIKPGQFIFGRNTAAADLNMKPKTVYNRIQKLKRYDKIDIQRDTHFSVVTILNWELYQQTLPQNGQAKGHPQGQARDRQGTGKGQAKDTNNNVNNVNNGGKVNNEKKEDNTPDFQKNQVPDFFLTLAKTFYDKKITQTDVKVSFNQEKWGNELWSLERIDKYSRETIENALNFALTNDFWIKNLISLAGIRVKKNNGLTKFGNILAKYESSMQPRKIKQFKTAEQLRHEHTVRGANNFTRRAKEFIKQQEDLQNG